MTFTDILFYLLAIVLLYAGVRVVLARHPVVGVLHLILAFFNASMLWILIGAEFLGLLLIIIYVGAVMVLFLFVVMMVDVVPETLRKDFRTYLPIGLVVGGVMVAEIAFILGSAYLDSSSPKSWPDTYNNTLALGIEMYSKYSYPIQVGALILLVGMIAAIALTLRERKNRKYVLVSDQLKVEAKDRVRLVSLPSEPLTVPKPEVIEEEPIAEQAPKSESSKSDAPKSEAKPNSPKVEANKAETSKSDAPKADATKSEAKVEVK
ncbi:NADH-quinone oxidoreductase subunit J [Taylorella equigenitalis]|uniref:NADH-quinone oxidoreductase subunit J n=1 Tax=Taylorella equigenitalis TaxID=29575 RepID=UPI0003F956D1|nr:NADH-quinone oxidoreductase subunit J [Taylorella equigenitalis]ASY37498.1 NADH-quinone oxidoreductase subunit J [Taylorella equigenitalis]KGK33066.1 NADH-ubiquinone oxidoreductase [Taylorella equigenitalis]